ncbi:hypothetical protein [Paenibacillus sp. GCM10027626]|uniref:hypothetical protein n=1 Tax=Paenibacillus sp. GCM10027626 TaxID=3273411 RepID=UPI00363C834E
MISYFRLSEEKRISLENRFAGTMPQHLLERGWDLYRREKVLSVQAVVGHSIYGVVKAPEIVAVTLDTEDSQFNTCTCLYKGSCDHMVAVYYAYCTNAGYDAEEAHNRLLGGGSKAAPSISAGKELPADGGDPQQWLGEMTAEYGQSWHQCRHSLHPLQQVLSSIKSQSKDWGPIIKKLHWIHAILFVLEQAEAAYRITDSYNRYYYEMAFSRMTEPWIQNYKELMQQLDAAELTEQEQKALQSLIYFFRKRDMERSNQLHRWETLYFALWRQLVQVPQFRQPEEAWLGQQMAELERSGREPIFYPLALAFLTFTDQEDTEAVALISKAPFTRSGVLACSFARRRLNEEAWPQLEMWMDYIYKELSRERKTPAFGPFIEMCCAADEKQPQNPRWQQYLIDFLPFSYSALAAHWLGRQQYDQWADLQILLAVDPGEIDVQHLREVSKEAPRVLMPLYHQAIDTAIRNRNRQGYKTAVKLMKKLERLYKADGQLERWRRYVAGLVQKYQRLRALQEELWRGKIIT